MSAPLPTSSVDLQLAGLHTCDTGRGITLAYQSFGRPSDPLLLLIMGLSAQMIEWPDRFCAMLAERGSLRVVRFDNRDAGFSTHLSHHRVDVREAFESRQFAEAAPYRIEDMADDAAVLIQALCAQQHRSPARAHIVGCSLGGMIAQELLLRHAHLVSSFCSLMSTPDLHLGSSTAEATAVLIAPAPTDRAGLVTARLDSYKVIGSEPRYKTDAAWHRANAELSFDRCFDPPGAARQLLALWGSPSRVERLRSLQRPPPALILHGAIDPLITLEGGEATAAALAGARLRVFEGMGHDLPQALWPDIVGEITELTRKAVEQERKLGSKL